MSKLQKGEGKQTFTPAVNLCEWLVTSGLKQQQLAFATDHFAVSAMCKWDICNGANGGNCPFSWQSACDFLMEGLAVAYHC